ncbi:RHS repeat-associated core domain-containing protein [Gilliamella sp. Nev5-1]|uniref:RHS repeat-associated core domain-containing protein n=1 Tax=Gilliamella sp. Nev5-1 TaxID=3120251 RepID=UPI0009E3BDD5|nr:RHS repeat-associated core domain-containing protein [Gilliamella apicola]
MHYNRYRYYDPYTARYISQDPIGLAGGENTYSYVPDLLDWIEPLGLSIHYQYNSYTGKAYDMKITSVKPKWPQPGVSFIDK